MRLDCTSGRFYISWYLLYSELGAAWCPHCLYYAWWDYPRPRTADLGVSLWNYFGSPATGRLNDEIDISSIVCFVLVLWINKILLYFAPVPKNRSSVYAHRTVCMDHNNRSSMIYYYSAGEFDQLPSWETCLLFLWSRQTVNGMSRRTRLLIRGRSSYYTEWFVHS